GPIYDRLNALGAVWGQKFGWERPNWFAPKGTPQKDILSFRRGNFFEPAREEARAVRERVGLQDLSGFSKYEVSGPSAEAMLDRLVANRLPRGVGRIQLCHALNAAGGVVSEFTITRLGPQSFYVVSAAAANAHDRDVLWRALPGDGSVTLRDVTLDRGVLVLAGPHARDVLRKLTDADLSSNAFPWLSGREILVDVAPVLALRVNFLGELGWELHHPLAYQLGLFQNLMDAGKEFDIRPVGIRAMDSLRIEKGYRYWRSDLTTEYTVLEAGMERFVKHDKGEFTGRAALVEQKNKGLPRSFVTVEVAAKTDSDPWGNEPLYAGGKMIGRTTSGAYAYTLDKSLALAYVDPAHARPATKMEIEMLGRRYPAVVIPESPYDPDNARIRA
ncbi:MAG: aminomethyltransferase family protein, partial [Rhodospirillales bacterium]